MYRYVKRSFVTLSLGCRMPKPMRPHKPESTGKNLKLMQTTGREEDTISTTHKTLGGMRSVMLPQAYYPVASNPQPTTTIHATNNQMLNPKPCTAGASQSLKP